VLTSLAWLSLCSCSSPFASASSPAQNLKLAIQAMSVLKSARADYVRNLWQRYPTGYPQLTGVTGGTLDVHLSGVGEVQFPDRFYYTITLLGLPSSTAGPATAPTPKTQLIRIQGVTYVSNALHGRPEFGAASIPLWVRSRRSGNLLPVDPFETLKDLERTLAPRDLGDVTIGGVRVHHLGMEADKALLLADLKTRITDPNLESAIRDSVQSETFHIEVWIDADDHLIRRISEDTSVNETIALLQAQLKLPALSSLSQQTTEIRGGFVLNLHDFNSPVTITAPSLN